MRKIFLILLFTNIFLISSASLKSKEIYCDSIVISNFKNVYKKCDTIKIEITNNSPYILSFNNIRLYEKHNKEWVIFDNNILCIDCDWNEAIRDIEVLPDSTKVLIFDTSLFFNGCPKKGKKYRLNFPFYLHSKDKKIINNRIEFNYEKKYEEFIYFTIE